MKKIVSLALVLSVALSLAACGKGSSFKKEKDKAVSALEKTCDAEELSAKDKKKVIKQNLKNVDDIFGEGAYVFLETDDVASMKVKSKDMGLDSKSVGQMLMYQATSGDERMWVAVIETSDKDTAKSYIDYMTKAMRLKELKKQFKSMKVDYSLIEEDDQLILAYELKGSTMFLYLKTEGSVIKLAEYAGEGNNDDIRDQYNDFMSEVGYYDMEAFLEEAE